MSRAVNYFKPEAGSRFISRGKGGTIKERLIRPALEIAVRDNIIRANPANGVIRQLNKKTQNGGSYVRHALTLERDAELVSRLG